MLKLNERQDCRLLVYGTQENDNDSEGIAVKIVLVLIASLKEDPYEVIRGNLWRSNSMNGRCSRYRLSLRTFT